AQFPGRDVCAAGGVFHHLPDRATPVGPRPPSVTAKRTVNTYRREREYPDPFFESARAGSHGDTFPLCITRSTGITSGADEHPQRTGVARFGRRLHGSNRVREASDEPAYALLRIRSNG